MWRGDSVLMVIKILGKFKCQNLQCGEEYAHWGSLLYYDNPSDGSLPVCPTCKCEEFEPIETMQIG